MSSDETARLVDLQQRVLNARESLDTELKPWFDPSDDHGRAEIARACIALRNFDGGHLIIGIKDDGSSDPDAPNSVRDVFSPDAIHDIVSRHSSERFDVAVDYVERDGIDRVIIGIPSGVRAPVSASVSIPRLPLGHQRAGTKLQSGVFYYRTLEANGRPSSAQATARDWQDLMTKCFNNREADVGAFLRRQLSSLPLKDLAEAILAAAGIAATGSQAPSSPPPLELARALADRDYERFLDHMRRKESNRMSYGFRESAAVLVGNFDVPLLENEILFRLGMKIFRSDQWPPYGSLMNAGHVETEFVDEGCQAFFSRFDRFNFLEFSRIEKNGGLYYVEASRDDLSPFGAGNVLSLEFALEIARVGEVIAVTIDLAKALTRSEEGIEIAMIFRWRGMSGRILSSWAHPHRGFHSPEKSVQDVIISGAVIPIETPRDAISGFVDKIVKPLFVCFGGRVFDVEVIEDIVDRRLNRKRT